MAAESGELHEPAILPIAESTFRLPRALIDRGLLARITPTAFVVYAVLCKYANGNRNAWPKWSTIMRLTGLSRPTVQRAIAELQGGQLVKRCHDGKRLVYHLEPTDGLFAGVPRLAPKTVASAKRITRDLSGGITSDPSTGSPVIPGGITSDPSTGSPVIPPPEEVCVTMQQQEDACCPLAALDQTKAALVALDLPPDVAACHVAINADLAATVAAYFTALARVKEFEPGLVITALVSPEKAFFRRGPDGRWIPPALPAKAEKAAKAEQSKATAQARAIAAEQEQERRRLRDLADKRSAEEAREWVAKLRQQFNALPEERREAIRETVSRQTGRRDGFMFERQCFLEMERLGKESPHAAN